MKRQSKGEAIYCFRRWTRGGYAVFASLNRKWTIGVLTVTMSIVTLATGRARDMGADTASIYRSVEMEAVGVSGRRATTARSLTSQTPVFNRTTESVAPLQTLESALRLSPAVDIRERGGKGVQTDISIRGGSFDQTMVTLNGINFTDARTGHQSHSLPIDINAVSAINVIDGVSGVGAYAGAVDIRTAPLYPRYISAELTGGGHGYMYGSLAGGCSTDRMTLMVTGSARHSDGYTHNTDFTNYNGYVRMTYDSRWGLFDAQAGYQNRAFGANGFYSRAYPDQYEQTSTALASLRWLRQGRRLMVTANASYRYNTDRYELIKGDESLVPFNHHITDNIGAEIGLAYDWIAGETSIGADVIYNHIYSTVLGDECDPKRIRGIDYNHKKGRTTLNATLRHTKEWRRFTFTGAVGLSNSDYGTDALWSLGASYAAGRYWRFDAGAVESMRLPTFNDLYYTATGYESDRDLKPEHAVTWHAGADFSRNGWSSKLYAYYRRGRNIIDWVKMTDSSNWKSTQITAMNTAGVEFSAAYATDGWMRRAQIAYGYVHQDSHSEAVISQYKLDHMHNKLSARIDTAPLRRFTLSVTGTLYDRMGGYTDRSGETHDYRPYFLLDARATYTLGKWQLYVDATNLTSTEYFDFGGLKMPDCWVSGGVVFTIR